MRFLNFFPTIHQSSSILERLVRRLPVLWWLLGNCALVTYSLKIATILSENTDFTVAVPGGFIRNVDAAVFSEMYSRSSAHSNSTP